MFIEADNLTRTPSDADTRLAVEAFLQTEPGWIENAINKDPALNQSDNPKREVLLYQGLHAIAFHRLAHNLYEKAQSTKATNRSEAADLLWQARALSQGVRRLTAGIEIHPGAHIGKNFFIDHGAGVVIGETTHIGDNVFLYHNVTLGAASGKEVTEPHGVKRRHPKIGNNVIISTGSKILGPATLEDDVKIGANVLIKGEVTIGKGAVIQDGLTITKNVPAGARVVGTLPTLPGDTRATAGELILAGEKSQSPFIVVGDGIAHFGRIISNLIQGKAA